MRGAQGALAVGHQEPLQVHHAYQGSDVAGSELAVLLVAPQCQEPEATEVSQKGDQKDLKNTLQGTGRSRAAGRLLPESGRLVLSKRPQRRPGELRLPVVGLHQPSDETLRSVQRWQQRDLRRLERTWQSGGSGHAHGLHTGMGCGGEQASEQTAGPQRPGGCPGMERGGTLIGQQGPIDTAKGRKDAMRCRRTAARCPSTGGVRPQVVTGQSVSCIWRQRQSALRVELTLPLAHPDIYRAPGGGESDRLVAPSSRPAGVRWRHRRSLHPLLEHADRPADAMRRHRLAGLQLGMEQTQFRASQHPRLFAEPDSRVEVPEPHAGGQAHRALVPGALSGDVARRRGDCHRRR